MINCRNGIINVFKKGVIMLTQFKKCIMLSILLVLPVATYAFDSFDCIGSDPLWKLSLTEKKFIFTQGKLSPINISSVQPKPAENMKIEHIRVYRAKMNEKKVVILIQKQSCSDDSSVDAFPYEGIIVTDDKVFHGCCSKKLILTN